MLFNKMLTHIHNLPNNQFKTHLFFFQFLGGGTLFSLDLGPELVVLGDNNFPH